MNYINLSLLKNCHSLRSLKSIHAQLLVSGSIFSSDLVLNKLLRVYSRFGELNYACHVFDQIPQPNSFLWTALIHGFILNHKYDEGLSLFRRMHSEYVSPLNFTIASVGKALARQMRVKDGDALYGLVLKCGFGFDLIVQNALLDLFMRFGNMTVARQLFDEMDEKDVVSWNTMISGYGNNGRIDNARALFNEMPEKNTISWTSMIDGYIKGGDIVKAKVLFAEMPIKDLASWNVMLAGCIAAGDLVGARQTFESMPTCEVGAWNMMISGFCKAGQMESAKFFFERMPAKDTASWAIMIDGYINDGDTEAARSMFDQTPHKNLICWSTMIGGYAKIGQPREALELYKHFKEIGLKPDDTFILGIISACSQLGILDSAEAVVRDYVGPSLLSNLRVVTSLIDMYAKCGSIRRAEQVFEMASEKDSLCYSTMILAFANHGLSQNAISLFEEMKKRDLSPDAVTFLGVLSACNHGGLVNWGRMYFTQMINEFEIHPSEKHYACVVDLLGRAGCLDEAYELINSMPISPTAAVWGALLAACRVHHNVQLGEIAASELFKIEPENSGNYILLCSIYAATGRWDGVAKVRAMIRERKVKKNRASSWIEQGSIIHEFVMGDMSHFASESIYFILDLLSEDMKLLGCAGDKKQHVTSASQHNV